jgi:hypothetical protein
MLVAFVDYEIIFVDLQNIRLANKQGIHITQSETVRSDNLNTKASDMNLDSFFKVSLLLTQI